MSIPKGYRIEATPTMYAGVTFRSLLEAQWAKWFDHNRLNWQYEPGRIDTAAGSYLPDFEVALWPNPVLVEIKPDGYTAEPAHWVRWFEVPKLSGKPLTVRYGHPDRTHAALVIDLTGALDVRAEQGLGRHVLPRDGYQPLVTRRTRRPDPLTEWPSPPISSHHTGVPLVPLKPLSRVAQTPNPCGFCGYPLAEQLVAAGLTAHPLCKEDDDRAGGVGRHSEEGGGA